MPPKRRLEATMGAKALPRGLWGTPPEQKDLKKTPKLTWESPFCSKTNSSGLLKESLPKHIFEKKSTVKFTCGSFYMKFQNGYDVCKKYTSDAHGQ